MIDVAKKFDKHHMAVTATLMPPLATNVDAWLTWPDAQFNKSKLAKI
jgi:hypothetical protein